MPAVNNDVIEMTVIHDNAVSGEQLNRFQYQLQSSTPVSDATLLDDVAFIIEGLYDLVKAIIAWRNILREVRVTNKTQDVLVGSTDAGLYLGGTSVGDDAPQAVSGHVYLTTNVPRVILSKYLPSPTVDDIGSMGEVYPAGLLDLVDFGAALLTPYVFGGATYTYGYFSPKVATFVVPQLATASGDWAYQRRRKPGRGA